MINIKSILLDVDEVITFSGFLEAVNDFMNTNYSIDDYTDYYIDQVTIPENRRDEFNKFLNNRNLYEKPDILPDAIRVIEELNKKYEIFICSSCVNPMNIEGSGRMFTDKYNFLIKYLPFLDPEHFIFTSVKKIYKADIQIDDRVNNFTDDVNMKILFPSYHNKEISDKELEEKGIIRAGIDYHTGWKEIEKMLIKKDLQ